tara:strand:+ start:18005 stop:19240 length:1236 start_codon:yes stop_codon:yes gene_type:complete
MSTLLKEAIVDANALRDAALKNAESAVINKYSEEVRKTLRKLLEQDELDLGLGGAPPPIGDEDLDAPATEDMGATEAPTSDESLEEDVEDVPYGATDGLDKMKGKNLRNMSKENDKIEVELDLGSLRESVQALQAEIDEELTFSEDELAEMLKDDEDEEIEEAISSGADNLFDEEEDSGSDSGSTPDNGSGALAASAAALQSVNNAGSGPKGSTIAENGDTIEISDELINDIVEKLTVDMGATLSGWAGRSAHSMKWEMEKEMAHRRGTEAHEDLEILKKAQEELVFENKQLIGRLSQYKAVMGELKETLQTVNLSNARLLYTNRVLRNTSLNERQKTKIAEAISKADSVTEAKTIHNTLQSTVESTPTRRPQSLSEAINRPSSVIRATRKEKAQPTDVFAERMRRLAGIN